MNEVVVDRVIVWIFEISFWGLVIASFFISGGFGFVAAFIWVMKYLYFINIKLNVLLGRENNGKF